jgi:Phospholipase B/S-layer like family, C-terminal region
VSKIANHPTNSVKSKSKSHWVKALIFGVVIQVILTCGFPIPLWAAEFIPDPHSIQQLTPAYRYPRAGWNIVHIEGKPADRGMQHGKLLAPEIAAYVRAVASFYEPKSPTIAWKQIRRLTNALFLRSYNPEQLTEMQGIADGASAAGAQFDNRPIDLIDIVALNSSNELESLNSALEATPTGLEVMHSAIDQPESPDTNIPASKRPPPKRQHCSAFAAVGSATKDGKIVFGHITMFDLYPANFYNIWLDVQPQQGHHFVMQTFPGGIHSGMDYIINDAGIAISETTLDQTRLNSQGSSLASRIRQASQYADSIEQAAKILSDNGNGLSTSEWILADLKRNEIALLTLGTNEYHLYRSSKNEWIAGATGFYWSDNNNKDQSVRLETIPSLESRPSALATFVPSKRDTIWLQMYDQYKGKIDLDFARQVLTKPELVSVIAVDAKYTNTDLGLKFKSWATFGPPVGTIRRPNKIETQNFPAIKPLISNPWVMLSNNSPIPDQETSAPAADLFDPNEKTVFQTPPEEINPVLLPAWHGTLLPANDADIWLTTAFANYERIVALENALRQKATSHLLQPDDLDQLGIELFYYRSVYELGVRSAKDVPLAQTRSNPRDENWYRVAAGKGVLMLHSLRDLIGAKDFDRLMDEFGHLHAGQQTTTAQFQSYLESGIDKNTGKNLKSFFDRWLNYPGLPHLELLKSQVRKDGEEWIVTVTIRRNQDSANWVVPVTVESTNGEVSGSVKLEKLQNSIKIKSPHKPLRVFVDKYGLTGRSNGSAFTILTFDSEVEKSLIVYGTLNEAEANHEAAMLLQQSVRRREHNITPVVKMDSEVTEQDLASHHLLLIGRPDSNSLVQRFQDVLPATFGSHSFEIRGTVYAHADSAIVMAIDNPLNPRYSVVTIAGLSGLSTLQVMSKFEDNALSYAQVVVLPHNQTEIALVSPAKNLMRVIDRE